jgi:hypothetical protein
VGLFYCEYAKGGAVVGKLREGDQTESSLHNVSKRETEFFALERCWSGGDPFYRGFPINVAHIAMKKTFSRFLLSNQLHKAPLIKVRALIVFEFESTGRKRPIKEKESRNRSTRTHTRTCSIFQGASTNFSLFFL